MRKSNYLLSAFVLLFIIFSFIPHPVIGAGVTLSLNPSSQTIAPNETFNINIELVTGGKQSSGVDAIIQFDNTKLNLLDIIPGTIFDQYIGKNINNTDGTANISGLANSTDTLFSGSGTFATLRFRALQEGTTQITFDYTPGNKNDTNVAVIDQSGDALDAVTNGTYTISASGSNTNPTTTSNTSTTNTNSSSSNTSTSQNNSQTTKGGNSMPTSGNSLPVILIAIIGGFFVWIGSFFGKDA